MIKRETNINFKLDPNTKTTKKRTYLEMLLSYQDNLCINLKPYVKPRLKKVEFNMNY